jgi:prepilin-type N-terminal cleavage/methylation domain-containing protein
MQRNAGFTLVEIAVVLVVIGLLLGAVLKGQELMTSAQVRNLMQRQDEIKAAYYGFPDRYQAPPGDYAKASGTISGVSAGPCGTPAPDGNGNGNYQIEMIGSEHTLAWEHLSKAGFLHSTYTCALVISAATTPYNAYGDALALAHDAQHAGGAQPRHNLKTGANIPSHLLGEMDRKIDDGDATRGTFRAMLSPSITPTDCYSADGAWRIEAAGTNCGGTTLF